MNIDALQDKPIAPEKEISTSEISQQIENLHTTLFSKLSDGLTLLKESLPTIAQQNIAENIIEMIPSLNSLRTTASVLLVLNANPVFAQSTLELLNNISTNTTETSSTTSNKRSSLTTIQQAVQDSKLNPSTTITVNKKLLQQALASQKSTPAINDANNITSTLPGTTHEFSGDGVSIVPSNPDTKSVGSIKVE